MVRSRFVKAWSIVWIGLMALTAQVVTVWGAESEDAVDLFNGKDIQGWNGLSGENLWKVAARVTVNRENNKVFDIRPGEGVLVNGDKGNTTNLISRFEHGDCYLHIEFNVPKDSNSGVYFQGLYEIQILDSFGKDQVDFSDCGGIYARYKDDRTYEGHPPRVNASRQPGRWQSFDAVFRAPRFDEKGEKIENARFVSVIHNGVLVHTNVELTGGTRASLDKPEAPKGPLMLQGDHGPVAYRNIRLVPLELK